MSFKDQIKLAHDRASKANQVRNEALEKSRQEALQGTEQFLAKLKDVVEPTLKQIQEEMQALGYVVTFTETELKDASTRSIDDNRRHWIFEAKQFGKTLTVEIESNKIKREIVIVGKILPKNEGFQLKGPGITSAEIEKAFLSWFSRTFN